MIIQLEIRRNIAKWLKTIDKKFHNKNVSKITCYDF